MCKTNRRGIAEIKNPSDCYTYHSRDNHEDPKNMFPYRNLLVSRCLCVLVSMSRSLESDRRNKLCKFLTLLRISASVSLFQTCG